jgi:4-amino-4-deoxy-L-arabinose transferase-like glycosyltransferase
VVPLSKHHLNLNESPPVLARSFRPHILGLLLVTLAGAALRVYNLQWGAPYYHFHIDEHFVFSGADMLARNPHEAAMSPKFFMYSPLPMYFLIGVRWIYEALRGPLVLTVLHDEVTFMVLGRAISALLGTATIPLVWLIARRISGPRAALIGAALAAFGVLHLRESHFFTVDIPLTFFSMLTLLALMHVVERITWLNDLKVGLAFAAALLCKYTAVFLVPVIGVAYLLSPGESRGTAADWIRRGLRACVPGLIGAAVFLACNPLVVIYYAKFRQDIADWVTAPLTGAWKPIWTAQFADIGSPHLYWFTNILWWGLGPGFELLGLAGVAWLFWRRNRAAIVAGTSVVAYFLVAAQTVTPFARYGVPLVPALAVAAGVLGSDLLAWRRWRLLTGTAVGLAVATTALYAVAYLHVFAAPDSRLSAAKYMLARAPAGSRVLVEPSQNMVPFGSYLQEPSFYRDYMLRGAGATREDHYHLVSLDTYVYLYDRRHSPEDKSRYIASRLAQADYIVMDDTFLQFYRHLSADEHGVVKQYYDDLFAGRLGFELLRTFKVYPSIVGVPINDDAAELSFRLFDHPRVYIFRRTAGAQSHG